VFGGLHSHARFFVVIRDGPERFACGESAMVAGFDSEGEEHVAVDGPIFRLALSAGKTSQHAVLLLYGSDAGHSVTVLAIVTPPAWALTMSDAELLTRSVATWTLTLIAAPGLSSFAESPFSLSIFRIRRLPDVV